MNIVGFDMPSKEASELERAKSEMDFYRNIGNGIGYKQAKRHYEKVLRKEKRKNGNRAS